MEIIEVQKIHKDIIGLLVKENLCFGEALGVLHETEIVLKKIMLPVEVVYSQEQ